MKKTIKDLDKIMVKYFKNIPTDDEIKKQEKEWIKNNSVVPFEKCLIYVPLLLTRDFVKELRKYLDVHPEYDKYNEWGEKHSSLGMFVKELLEERLKNDL